MRSTITVLGNGPSGWKPGGTGKPSGGTVPGRRTFGNFGPGREAFGSNGRGQRVFGQFGQDVDAFGHLHPGRRCLRAAWPGTGRPSGRKVQRIKGSSEPLVRGKRTLRGTRPKVRKPSGGMARARGLRAPGPGVGRSSDRLAWSRNTFGWEGSEPGHLRVNRFGRRQEVSSDTMLRLRV